MQISRSLLRRCGVTSGEDERNISKPGALGITDVDFTLFPFTGRASTQRSRRPYRLLSPMTNEQRLELILCT